MQTRKIQSFLILFAVGLLAGCGGSGDNVRTVTIDTQATYWDQYGAKSVGPQTYISTISIERPGDARSYPATLDASRLRWTADDVPVGPYQVRMTYTYGYQLIVDVASGASGLDLGMDLPGRAESQYVAQSTPVTLAFSGLSPWDPAADWFAALDWDAPPRIWPNLALKKGATGGAASPLDWKGRKQVNPADTLSFVQYRASPIPSAPAGTYEIAVAAQSVTGIGMTDGVPLTIAVGMTPPAGTATVRVNWKQSQYAALLDASGSKMSSYGSLGARLTAQSVASSSITLMQLEPNSISDADYGVLTYNRFLRAPNEEFLSTTVEATVRRALPGTTNTVAAWPTVSRFDPIGAIPDPLVPVIGPAVGVTVNGMNASQPVRGAGLTPTIAWQPPRIGTADIYFAYIMEVWANADGADMKDIVGWYLSGTSLKVPAGLLEAGKFYLLYLTATSDPSGPGMAAPFRKGARGRGSADFVSAVIEP